MLDGCFWSRSGLIWARDCPCIFPPYDFLLFYSFFFIFRPHLRLLEVPRLEVKLELLLAYITATAIWNLSCICNPLHSLWQCWILNPLSKARNQTCILRDISQVLNPLRQECELLPPFSCFWYVHYIRNSSSHCRPWGDLDENYRFLVK